MTRAKWKGPYVDFKKQTIIVSRNSKIIPKFVGKTVKVHNGKKYSNLIITQDMLNHKFGEFFLTRAKFSFKKKKSKK
jgi:small subunit ribosomal protein S19